MPKPKLTYPRFTLDVTLKDSPYPIEREIVVSSTDSLNDLHFYIQSAMPWQNYHLHEFRREIGSNDIVTYGDAHFEEVPSENDTKLHALDSVFTKKGDTILYEYDFGDGWLHEIKLLNIIHDPQAYPVTPFLRSAKGACPPEDCGGPPGFAHFLEVLNNTKHPEHKETKQWGESQGFRGTQEDEDHLELHLSLTYHKKMEVYYPDTGLFDEFYDDYME